MQSEGTVSTRVSKKQRFPDLEMSYSPPHPTYVKIILLENGQRNKQINEILAVYMHDARTRSASHLCLQFSLTCAHRVHAK